MVEQVDREACRPAIRIHAKRVLEDQFRHDVGVVLIVTSDQDDSTVDSFRGPDLRRQVPQFLRPIRDLLVEIA